MVSRNCLDAIVDGVVVKVLEVEGEMCVLAFGIDSDLGR
jgi:hypothetical protein